jgi:hypothetical protein
MCSKCTLCVSLPNADIVIPMIIRKDPTVTARHACHRQADVTRPWERKLEKEGFTVSPTNGPQCSAHVSPARDRQSCENGRRRPNGSPNRYETRVVSRARLAHRSIATRTKLPKKAPKLSVFTRKVPFLRQKLIEIYRLSSKNLLIIGISITIIY